MTTPFAVSRRFFLQTAAAGLLLGGALLPGCTRPPAAQASTADYLLYVGTYAQPDSAGILLYRVSPATGALTRVGGFRAGENPSYLTLDARHRNLYAVNEQATYQGAPGGAVSAFAVDGRTGALTLRNQEPSRGGAPCYVSLDATNKVALVANYGSGNVSVLPIRADGSLAPPTTTDQHRGQGPHKNQRTAHAHCFLPGPGNRFAFAVDLGTDTVYRYRLAPAQGTTARLPAPAFVARPGAGPRHLTFAPDGRRAYLISELNSSLTALTYDAAQGTLQETETVSTLPAGYTGESYCADVHVAPDGRFVYGSNRGHNSIVVFAVDAQTGRLTLVQHEPVQGNWPRNFTLDPTGRLLLVANQRSNNIVAFRVDPQTGRLTPTGQTARLPAPVCLKLVEDFTQ